MNSSNTLEIVTSEPRQYVHSSKSLRDAIERNGRVRWWKRQGSKKRGFHFLDAKGQLVCSDAQCERIRALGIPPAWKEVRIAPSARSPLQAVGVDASGRIQYLYHSDFVAQQQQKSMQRSSGSAGICPHYAARPTSISFWRDSHVRKSSLSSCA